MTHQYFKIEEDGTIWRLQGTPHLNGMRKMLGHHDLLRIELQKGLVMVALGQGGVDACKCGFNPVAAEILKIHTGYVNLYGPCLIVPSEDIQGFGIPSP